MAEAVQYSENYSSVEEHTDWLRGHLEEEVRDGRMVKYRKEDMEKRFGQNFAVASLAVLVSPDSGKKRLVHDGTLRVGVNHRIRCRNQLRMPGVREKFYLLQHYQRKGEVLFSVTADVAKAHRRVKIRREEWGMLACQCSEDDDTVYCNTV